MEYKKNSYAWETKSLFDRASRKEQNLLKEFHFQMDPLDQLVLEFKEKMRVQLDHITMKLQSIVDDKENDSNSRKAMIHKKLAKHVNKACNLRCVDTTCLKSCCFCFLKTCLISLKGGNV